MTIASQNVTRTLLLGAGFSKNFGLPLAKEVLVEMFNRIQSPILKIEILHEIEKGNNDFEAYYAEKTTGDDIIENDSKEVKDALLAVYKMMDKHILRSFNDEKFSYLKVISFINKFSVSAGGCGYVFTLNQDLLLERLFATYLKEKNFYKPGGWNGEYEGALLPYYGPVSSPFYKYGVNDDRDKKTIENLDDVTEEKIIEWDKKSHTTYEEKTRKIPCLVKLHGTYYWTKNNGTEQLWGIGENKLKQIEKEPLLELQYRIFVEILTERNQCIDIIYIIGYSFCDDHINEILYRACEKGSRLIIIDVLPLKELLDSIDKAFKRIGKSFDKKWLYQYKFSDFRTFFPFCNKTSPSLMLNGDSNESIATIDNLPCELI